VTILFSSDSEPPEPWRQAFARAMPGMPFRVWPDSGPLEDIRYALIWRPDPEALLRLPNLKAILVLGAGVDVALSHPGLPASIPVVRLLDAGMADPMAEYALHAVLHFQRRMREYAVHQQDANWRPLPWKLAQEWPVGVMGLGIMGGLIARRIAALGYPVAGWVRSPRTVEGIEVFAGMNNLRQFLARTRVVINALPLTPETQDILGAKAFAAMPAGAFVVNIGRGAHLVDEDLIDALDSGHLEGAMLDVFRQEPLPASHAFWRHPKIVITPHVAAPTIIAAAEIQVIENIRRLERGEPPLGVVDRNKGY
jgi:glyoxylate/hydroxypyruvate reductase A